MDYNFNVEIAKKYGVDGAIIIQNLFFWIIKNKANKKHFHEERYWTYNSTRAFVELFPFWTQRQIERILKNLEKDGAIITNNFNEVKYDRTKWYSLTDTVESIYANGKMEITKDVNENTQTVKPIPDSKPVIKPYKKQQRSFDSQKFREEKRKLGFNHNAIDYTIEQVQKGKNIRCKLSLAENILKKQNGNFNELIEIKQNEERKKQKFDFKKIKQDIINNRNKVKRKNNEKEFLPGKTEFSGNKENRCFI